MLVYPVAGSAGHTRVFLKHHLLCLGHKDLVDDGCLILSELVTNALAAIPGMPIWVFLDSNHGYPILEVWDGSSSLPESQFPDDDAECGRGLIIVAALATDWGSYLLDDGRMGKIVWARLK